MGRIDNLRGIWLAPPLTTRSGIFTIGNIACRCRYLSKASLLVDSVLNFSNAGRVDIVYATLGELTEAFEPGALPAKLASKDSINK